MKHRSATGLLVITLMILFGWGGAAIAGVCGGATPCKCGDSVIADRTLDASVDPICSPPACTRFGLLISSNVTLTMHGCTITGSDADDGIHITDRTNVTLTGGTVTKFLQGVVVIPGEELPSNVKISGMTVHSNKLEGMSLIGENLTVELTTVRDNGGAGIEISGPGNTVTTSKVSRNGGDGVIFDGDEGFVTRNRIELNIGAGLLLNGNDNKVSRNYLQYNESDGLDLEGDRNLVSLNRIYANGRRPRTPINPDADGVHLGASSNLNTLSRNNINFNAGFGINDDSGHLDNIFTGNGCRNNGKGPSDPPDRC